MYNSSINLRAYKQIWYRSNKGGEGRGEAVGDVALAFLLFTADSTGFLRRLSLKASLAGICYEPL